MKRRSILFLVPATATAGCASPGSGDPRPQVSGALDYTWPDRHPGLTSGFCFTVVRGIQPYPLIKRLNGEELQRIEWEQVLGPGDGEVGVRSRFFVALARVGESSIIVEDNGALGVTPKIVQPLSGDGGLVIGYRGGGGHSGRLVVFRDGDLALDLDVSAPDRAVGTAAADYRKDLLAVGLSGRTGPAEPTSTALTFIAQQTGIELSEPWLRTQSYLLVSVPQA